MTIYIHILSASIRMRNLIKFQKIIKEKKKRKKIQLSNSRYVIKRFVILLKFISPRLYKYATKFE
jgi:hypothetical protein